MLVAEARIESVRTERIESKLPLLPVIHAVAVGIKIRHHEPEEIFHARARAESGRHVAAIAEQERAEI